MRHPIVFMFSGQGSHFYGMGHELYQSNATFRKQMDLIDLLARPNLRGETLTQILFNPPDPNAAFAQIQITHPALFAIQYALAKTITCEGPKPDFLLGYSLGEYIALCLAGVLSLKDALSMVQAQARILDQHAHPGTMMAILGDAQMVRKEPKLFRGTWIAAINFDKHFVVSGSKAKIQALYQHLFERDITAKVLEVNHGFHSPLVDPAEEPFLAYAREIDFGSFSLPYFSSRNQGQISHADAAFLWSVCRGQVGFRQTLIQLNQQHQPIFVDIGPSATLATFARYICGDPQRCLGSLTQWGRDTQCLDSLLQRLYENK